MNNEPITATGRYFSDFGGRAAIRWHECTGPIRVLAEPDSEEVVGMAHPSGPSRCGLVLYRLEVEGADPEGDFFCVNRVFVPALPEDRNPAWRG